MCTTMPNHYDYSKLIMNMFKFTTRGILSGRKYSQLNTFSMPNTKTLIRQCHTYKVISKLKRRLQNLLKKMLPSKSYLRQETQIMNVQYLCKWWSFKMAHKPESWRWQHMSQALVTIYKAIRSWKLSQTFCGLPFFFFTANGMILGFTPWS